MPAVDRFRRATPRRLVMRDDGGVIAVITAILVASVLVPVAALGLTSYVRVAIAEEMQRAAESGALAGAASLGLLDTGSLLGGSIADETLAVPDAFATLGPNGRACRAAASAHGLVPPPAADPDADQDPDDRSPTTAAFGSIPACDAYYTPDPAYAGCVDDVFDRVTVLTDVVDARLAEVSALITPVTGPLLPTITDSRSIARAVQRLVPAITHNGVQVELDYAVEGPLDGVLTGNGPTERNATAAARRLFKPLLPDLTALDSLPAGEPLDQVLELTDLLDDQLTYAEQLAVAQLQAVIVALRVIVDDIDAVDLETALGGALEQALDEAEEELTDQLNALPLLGPVLTALTSTLLEPLRRDVVVPVTSDLGPCLDAARELLDDLSYALTVNEDEDDQDLVPCLVDHVLGLDQLGVSPAQACVNRVFRAQLAPTS